MSAVTAMRAAHRAGVRVFLEGQEVRLAADREPPAELLAQLRLVKPEIAAILSGGACRTCGVPLPSSAPPGVLLVYADRTAECMGCADREVGRLLAAAERVVSSPDALADPAEMMLQHDGLTL